MGEPVSIRVYTTFGTDEKRRQYVVCGAYMGPDDAVHIGDSRRVYPSGSFVLEHAAAQARRELSQSVLAFATALHLKEAVTVEYFPLMDEEG